MSNRFLPSVIVTRAPMKPGTFKTWRVQGCNLLCYGPSDYRLYQEDVQVASGRTMEEALDFLFDREEKGL